MHEFFSWTGRLATLMMVAVTTCATVAHATDPETYFREAQGAIEARRAVKPVKRPARNVILFVGDGMDVTTVTAARIFDGQSRGEPGEENVLSFERFPHLALSKTYTTNAQTSDSAGTMSAMVTGVKTKSGVISLTDAAEYDRCEGSEAARIATIGERAEIAGLSVGVVTTTRLTHATPAAVYAHSPNRNWERDTNLPEEAIAGGCKDIAQQLLEFSSVSGVDVALGGGRSNFLTIDDVDPEYPTQKGGRRDGRNLTAEWAAQSSNHKYVWSTEQFAAIDVKSRPKVLGLFEPSHMQYEADRGGDTAGEPSLAEMTAKAIEILAANKRGYFLMVEGGRIDHAHHAGNAARALKDTQALADAVRVATEMTGEDETLIIVTADHGHTLSLQGYPVKNSPILGLATATYGEADEVSEDGFARAGDKKRYTTLGYANGPGSILYGQKADDGGRVEPTSEAVADLNYRQQAAIPSQSETHGGQDVAIYAKGPQAYLFDGVVEQNYIFHVIDGALRLESKIGKARSR